MLRRPSTLPFVLSEYQLEAHNHLARRIGEQVLIYWRFRHIHRADFHRGLLECATDLGIVLHLNSKVVEIDAYEPSVSTEGGKSYKADLIVASDGMATTYFS